MAEKGPSAEEVGARCKKDSDVNLKAVIKSGGKLTDQQIELLTRQELMEKAFEIRMAKTDISSMAVPQTQDLLRVFIEQNRLDKIAQQEKEHKRDERDRLEKQTRDEQTRLDKIAQQDKEDKRNEQIRLDKITQQEKEDKRDERDRLEK